jgi:hypothetical protein
VQAAAENRGFDHAGRRARRLGRFAERRALDPQQRARGEAIFEFGRPPQSDDPPARNEREAVTILGLLHVMRGYE